MSKDMTTKDMTTTATKTKRPVGRPTKYKPEYCQAIIKFMQQKPFETLKLSRTNTKGESWTEEKRVPALLKFIEDFAWEIGVDDSTLIRWTEEHKDFRAAYVRAKHLQKKHLLQCGFAGVSDSTMTKFAAVNLTDLRDKTEVEHSGNLSMNDAGLALGIAQGRRRVESRQVEALPAPNPVSALRRIDDREFVSVPAQVKSESTADSELKTGELAQE